MAIYIYISTFIRINTLNMCSLLYFNYHNLMTEWMNCSLAKRKESIFSCQWWVLPKVLWLPQELTEHFGQVLSEEICLVLIMHNKKEIGDRNPSTSRGIALRNQFHRLVHFIISVNSLGQCLIRSWHSVNSGGSCYCSGWIKLSDQILLREANYSGNFWTWISCMNWINS